MASTYRCACTSCGICYARVERLNESCPTCMVGGHARRVELPLTRAAFTPREEAIADAYDEGDDKAVFNLARQLADRVARQRSTDEAMATVRAFRADRLAALRAEVLAADVPLTGDHHRFCQSNTSSSDWRTTWCHRGATVTRRLPDNTERYLCKQHRTHGDNGYPDEHDVRLYAPYAKEA